MKIGIVLPNWIGDIVMATPALRALRSHFGEQATLTGIVRPYGADVLAGTPWLDEYLLYMPRSRDRALRVSSMVRRLRPRNLDAIVLLTNSLRTALIAWLSGAKQRVGYLRNIRGPLLTTRLKPLKKGRLLEPVSAVDYYLETAYSLGCPAEPRRVELATTVEEELAAARVWHKHGLKKVQRVVTFNAGGAYGAAKHWRTEYFSDLARRFVQDSTTAVLVLCGPQERDTAREIVRLAAHPRVRSLAAEELSIGLSKACVRRSQLLISTDSGPRHFAAGFDVPCVTLFGPTDPRWSHNYHPREMIVRQELSCSPCGKRVCPRKHHECMQTLTPEYVFHVAQRSCSPTLGCCVA
jgi:heptosyltransferase-2